MEEKKGSWRDWKPEQTEEENDRWQVWTTGRRIAHITAWGLVLAWVIFSILDIAGMMGKYSFLRSLALFACVLMGAALCWKSDRKFSILCLLIACGWLVAFLIQLI